MANTQRNRRPTAEPPARQGGGDAARTALIEAAKRLLPDRPPASISGRHLADEAGVNYGLIHHYFGTKDAVLREGLRALRDEFLAQHGDPANLPLLTARNDPHLHALVRSQVDYPNEVSWPDDFPAAGAVVRALAERLKVARPSARRNALQAEAKARAIAMLSLQITYGVFQEFLFAGTEVGPGERPAVERALARIYADIALQDDARSAR